MRMLFRSFRPNALSSHPNLLQNLPIFEMEIITETTPIKDQYGVTLSLDFSLFLNITFEGDQDIISGNTKLSVLNKGGDPIEINIARV